MRSGSCCATRPRACGELPLTLRVARLTSSSRLGIFLDSTNWDDERFNILLRLDPDPGAPAGELRPYVEVYWSYAERVASGFRPYDRDAPSPAWRRPEPAGGMFLEDGLYALPFRGRVSAAWMRGYGLDGADVDLVLRDPRLQSVSFQDGWSCVGSRDGRDWTTGGEIYAFATVEELEALVTYASGRVWFRGCAAMAGLAPDQACSSTPRSEWPYPPDATCDSIGCEEWCDGTESCNAWLVVLRFAAYSIDEE